tara:strand:+ start:2403 stop:3368 length:966 start_codon:yes stop_codon:yes gene_type:complete
MIKLITFIAIAVFYSGCATVTNQQTYNVPFINSDETVQLQIGMTKSEVLDKIGNPLFVKSGLNNTIIWIYEVRTIEVLSDTDLKAMEIRYNKTNPNTRHSNTTHRIEITFINDKVNQWIRIAEEKDEQSNDEIIEKEQKPKKDTSDIKPKKLSESITIDNNTKDKQNWIFSPSITLGTTLDDLGTGLGIKVLYKNVGIELNGNMTTIERNYGYNDYDYYKMRTQIKSNNFLFLYQRNLKKIIAKFGLGLSTTERTNSYKWYEGDSWSEDDDESFKEVFPTAKFGLGKHFQYKKLNYTPMLEVHFFEEEIGFNLTTSFNFFK